MLMMVLVVGGLISLGIWAVTRLTGNSPAAPLVETRRQILDRRLASGEITTEEYAETRHILEGRSATGSTPRA
jgi:uncharacterized membrane protein